MQGCSWTLYMCLGNWGCRGRSACAKQIVRIYFAISNSLEVQCCHMYPYVIYSFLGAWQRSSPGMKNWRGRSTALFLRHPGTRLAWGQEIAGRVDVRKHPNTWGGAIFLHHHPTDSFMSKYEVDILIHKEMCIGRKTTSWHESRPHDEMKVKRKKTETNRLI